MNKHTPAPWTITNGRCIYGSGDLIKPFVASVEDDHNDSETAANARLIAAAPDLLAVLRGFVEWGEQYENDTADEWTNELLKQTRAAIAKATGDAQ